LPIWSGPEGSSHNEFHCGSLFGLHPFSGFWPFQAFGLFSFVERWNFAMSHDGLDGEDDLPEGGGMFDEVPDDKTFSMFGDEPVAAPPKKSDAYVVLARKYRPQRFEDLIGQEAMVRTLTNAFASDRIAHAFMMTGVRGVGKTTTARLIARALNYQSDTVNQPSITLDPLGSQCEAITRGNHPDVFELDAASRTGVGDMRELLDGVRYGPIAARYKVYIIDEVHMLSTSAFNALLKTLEEPPPHVKFIFATTEIRKVPVTILSRCQRFDLRRVEPAALTNHLERICGLEGAKVDRDGLELIARAAEGSVRDGLSLLDQAIVQDQGAGVTGANVRDMLGLADRTRTLDLLAAILKGDAKAALLEFSEQYQRGAEPTLLLRDVLDLTHDVARGEALGAAWQPHGPSDQVVQMRGFAKSSSPAALSRLWQMLLRGFEETGRAPDPVQAAEMCLLRVCAALQLPPPEDLARLLLGQGGAAPVSATPSASAPAPSQDTFASQATESAGGVSAPSPFPTFETFLDALDETREIVLQTELERFVRVVSFGNNRLVFEALPGAPADLQRRTAQCLSQLTDSDWIVDLGHGGRESIVERNKRREGERLEAATQDPLVMAALKAFPGAKIVEVRAAPVIEAVPSVDEDDGDDDGESNVLAVDFGRRRVAE
jgi:DNA polymerase III subunit gamma/tau